MSRTLAHILRPGDRSEAAWVTWIGTLEAWERNLVFRHELEWHDLFVSGRWTWADLEQEIAATVAAW